MDTGDVLLPLDAEAYESLLLDIGKHGVRCAVVYAADGVTIIDGRNRVRAATTLGRDWPREVLPIDDANEILAATMLYNRPRIVNDDARNEIIMRLDADGKTQRAISELTGVPRSTVSDVLRRLQQLEQVSGTGHALISPQHAASRQAHPSNQPVASRPRKVDALGRKQPARRITPTEQARRFGMMVKLAHEGHSGAEIARALDVSPSQVRDELRTNGFPLQRTGMQKPKGEVVGEYRWRDDEQPKNAVDSQRWRRSRVMFATQAWCDEFTEQSFANIYANHVREAIDANDHAWLMEAQKLIVDANDKMRRLLLILTDDAYRDRCWQTTEGDEIGRTSLRLVE